MINRRNWLLTIEYLDYRSSVDQLCAGSLQKEETHVRILLEWLQETPFSNARDKRPTLPEYLQETAKNSKNGAYSATYIKKILSSARRFFEWLAENKSGYKKINTAWRKTLKAKRLTEIPTNREAVSLEEIKVIASAPAPTIGEKRIQAMAVFLFLSGMRISAFVSLPIQGVDIINKKIMQFPNMGVRTKNRKHAITFLLDIPELLEVVQAWDKLVRETLPETGFWFAPLSPDTGEIDPTNTTCPESRASLATRQLKTWLSSIGIKAYSPHKFRHGHVHYGLERSQTIADYKAVSMNVMHSNMEITDQFYSVLNENSVQNRIQNLGNKPENSQSEEELFREFLAFKRWKDTQE